MINSITSDMIDLFDHAFIFCVVGQYLSFKIAQYISNKEIAKFERLTTWRNEIEAYHGSFTLESLRKKEYYFRNTDFLIEIVKVNESYFLLIFSSLNKKLESYDYDDYTKAELHFHMICDVVSSTLKVLE